MPQPPRKYTLGSNTICAYVDTGSKNSAIYGRILDNIFYNIACQMKGQAQWPPKYAGILGLTH